MILIVIAHAIAALASPILVARLGRRAFPLLALVPAAGAVWVALTPADGRTEAISWVPGLHMQLDFRFDSLARIMAMIVLTVGALVLVYCARYFEDDEPRLGFFAGELVAFAGVMFALVTTDNTLVLLIFWELTTVLSFLLVGHYAERATSRRAATQALLVTTAGGLAMLVGIIVLGELPGGSYTLSELVANPPSGTAAATGVALILVGALSKSAIVPLHFWLPGAMAAPTPVSAYLHAAAMVKAGVYLVARLSPGFSDSGAWAPMVLVLGTASMLLAGWRAMRVHDLKLVLAYGTVSQLGLMVMLVGLGTETAMLAGLTMVVAHSMFKAALFMIVGIIDHSAGTRDMHKLGWLGDRAPFLLIISIVAAFSMAGLPPLLGFVGKEAALAAVVETPVLSPAAGWALTAALVVGSMLTLAYSIRFIRGAFGRKHLRRPSKAVANWHAPDAFFLSVPTVLAAAGLVTAIVSPWLGSILETYSSQVPALGLPGRAPAGTPEPYAYHLSLWHGFTLELGLTAIVIVGGVAIYFVNREMLARGALTLQSVNADRIYDATLRGMDTASNRLTGFVQRGSLPLTQTIILVCFALLPTIVLITGNRSNVEVTLWSNPWQVVVGLIMIPVALAAVIMRNRLAATLLVGLSGYGVGVIFALQGAPDLALTQFLVETLLLVVFILVLRKLPPEVDERNGIGRRGPRAILAIAVGASAAAVTAFASAARSTEPIATMIPDLAYEFGDGANPVNVLLVDIRAWDTMGEVAVLVAAATGVASLVFRNRRFGTAPRVADAPDGATAGRGGTTWLRGGTLIPSRYRSLILQVTTRLVFPTLMVLSVYFFFSGHNAPGGGFAGGLTAGLALVLRYLAGGRYELGETIPIDAGKILGAGLAFAAGTAIFSLLLGAPVLSSATLEVTLPILGHIKLVTALFFDLGVYLIVIGLVLDILRSLGARLDSSEEQLARRRRVEVGVR